MSNFVELNYQTDKGVLAPVDPGSPDNPFFGPGQSDLSREVLGSRITAVSWMFQGRRCRLEAADIVSAALDEASDLLVVSFSYSNATWSRPNNAVVVAPNGRTDHQIMVPRHVEILIETWKPVHLYAVEAIDSVRNIDRRIAIDLNFRYEWIERRYYCTATRQWRERDHVYRK